MKDNEKIKCEFCGKDFDENELEPTSFVGYYCKGCHALNAYEARGAIREIRQRAKNKIKE